MAKTITIGNHDYEVISDMKAKGQNLYVSYKWAINNYGIRTLYCCYDRPSVYKEMAFDYCQKLLRDFDFFDNYTIIAYNIFQFTFGAIVKKDNKTYCLYVTRAHNYLVELTLY